MFCGVFSSNGHTDAGVSYTCQRVARGLVDAGLDTVVHVPWQEAPAPVACAPAVPRTAARFLRRWVAPIQEARFLRAFDRVGDTPKFAYLWPDASLALVRKLKHRRIPMVREMINCHVATAQPILDEAYRRHGLPRGPISDAHVAYEHAVLGLMDLVVAPGPGVVTSLLRNGVPEHKIVHSSYGWDDARIRTDRDHASGPADGKKPTFLFVGTLCLRKGIDTLLAAWQASGVDARLVLLGGVDAHMKPIMAAAASASVVHVPYSPDVASYYDSADIFVMPSLEEGGPLVTYEAIGAGLPIIATGMGGGYALVEGRNGILVPDADVDALAAAIRSMAQDTAMRARYAAASKAIAHEYSWKDVALRRATTLIAAVETL